MTRHWSARWAHLSFRAKLTIGVVSVACVAVTTVSALNVVVEHRRAMDALREKARRYALLLAPQLRAAVAFNDQLTAHELFSAFSADDDVTGLAVYRGDGSLIDGIGRHPAEIHTVSALAVGPADAIVVVAAVNSSEGPTGRLFLSLTSSGVERESQRRGATAAGIALLVIIGSILVATMMSRMVTRRVTRIADAAGRVARGDLHQSDLDPGSPDDIGHLTIAFNTMVNDLRRQFVERANLAATEQARLAALVAARTAEVEESREQYRMIAESTNAIPFLFDQFADAFTYVGPQVTKRFGTSVDAWGAPGFLDTLMAPDEAAVARRELASAVPGQDFEFESTIMGTDGRRADLRWVVSCTEGPSGHLLRGLILDVTEQRRLETDLHQAQKLESVGRLAAGVAHEINTPIQFVSDSVHFIRESLQDIVATFTTFRTVQNGVVTGTPSVEDAQAAGAMAADVDVDYLFEHLPKAVDRALDGLGRVTTIVRAMKEFAHPDAREMTTIDLNRAVESTLVISRNEYKYVADLQMELGELPPVTCHPGEINQVVLNIVVNAAHAIADAVGNSGRKGLITVRSRTEGDRAVIEIIDTGTGITPEVRSRMFDPFFTTKKVGQGTGQGLAIARSVIVDKHSGELLCESTPGAGASFIIRLPLAGRTSSRAARDAA